VQVFPLPEIKNPNAGGGGQDSRSFLIMLIVMMGVIFGVQYWRGQHDTTPPTPAATSSPATAAPGAASNTAPTAAATAPAAKSVSTTPAVQAAAETSTIVENELYRITFSNRGAQVTSWILKKYKDNAGQPVSYTHLAPRMRYHWLGMAAGTGT